VYGVSKENILLKITPLTPTGKSGRLFKMDVDEMNTIELMFAVKQYLTKQTIHTLQFSVNLP